MALCEGCGADLGADETVRVREIETGLVLTLGSECCLPATDDVEVL
jgi:hypothetical protein